MDNVQEQTNIDLFAAVRRNDEDKMLLLLQSGADVNCVVHRNTPLHIAAAHGNHKFCKMLINFGAQVDVSNLSCDQPLHRACTFEHLKVAKLLISAGANVDSEDFSKFTPLHCAVLADNRNLVKLLLKNNANVLQCNILNDLPLHYACAGRDVKIIELLLEKEGGKQVNFKGLGGNSPLHIAVCTGNLKAVKILIISGANVDSINDVALTPLKVACQAHSEIVEVLLANGADVNIVDNCGYTALERYHRNADLSIIRTLLAHLVKLNFSNAFISRKNMEFTYGPKIGILKSFVSSCEMKLKDLNNERISENRSWSYFDLLIKSEKEILLFLRNDLIREKIKVVDFVDKFGMYATCAELKIITLLRKAELRAKCQSIVCSVLPEKMPVVCVSKIMRYLNENDMNRLAQDD